METTYKITRHYKDDPDAREVIITNLTKEQAQEHCKNPETSSSTCTNDIGRKRTEKYGEWFDAWSEE